MSDLIGSGLAFPLRADQRGGLALTRGVEDIEQAIALILGTAPGERPMRPEFGCAVHDVVFDTIDAAIVGRILTAVHEALERWEPPAQPRLPVLHDPGRGTRMSTPALKLDGRTDRDLVSEARTRIAALCP